MIPILFPAEIEPERLLDCNAVLLNDTNDIELWASGNDDVRDFDTIGLGVLTDCISCSVTEERNGEYELAMEYPITGAHFSDIELRCIILAKPNYSDVPQAFRIYTMTTPIDGVVTIAARHLSYDLSGVPVLPFTATSAAAACQGLIDNAAIDTPFTVNTQVGTIADFKADVPASVRSWFGGKEGSLIDVYGGEWAYDNYTCTLKAQRGADRGVTIRYGVNLIDFEQEKNCEATYTGVLPYWADEDGNLVRAEIINLDGSFDYRRIMVLDLSMDFEEQPTAAQLTARAESYITNNKIGVPKVSITLDWVQISELSDRVELCDTVHVVFEKIGVEASAKVVRAVWDVLKDRYSELEIGEPKTNITDTIAGLEQETEKATSSVSAVMLGAIARATAAITGNSGGYVVLRDSDGDGQPDEILIMDTPDISTATKVWRWNQSGLGYSSSGAEGPFGLAMTSSGEIVADYITTGTLSAVDINGVNITGSTISGNTISGGTITGATINNGSGTFVVDASGNVTANSLTSSNATITGGSMAIQNLSDSYSVITLDGSNFDASLKSGSFRIDRIDGTGYVYISPLFIHIEHNDDVSLFGPEIGVATTQTIGVNKKIGDTTYPGGSMYADGSGTTYNLRLQATNNLILAVGSSNYVAIPSAYSHGTTVAPNMVVASNGYLYRSASSSKRYKHDITDKLDEDPEALYNVRVVQFKYNDDYISKDDQKYGKNIVGFIAEDVAEAMPGAVECDDEGRPEMWNVHVIVPAMMKLIQNQKKEIDELKARLDRLEARFFDDGR